jgi:carbon storage regulator CsrA
MSLLVTRKPQESIDCYLPNGETITVTIVEVRGQCVRVSIAAPRSVRILRTELVERGEPDGNR